MSDPRAHARWYVIQCRPRQELRALENLERQSFACYLPTVTVEKLRHGSKREIQEALFPGYLFISLDEATDNWHPVHSTRGVVQIVRFQESPAPMPERVVEEIRQRLTSQRPRIPYLQAGDRVRIVKGAFSNVEAMFVASDGGDRVLLLMSILRREHTLGFPVASMRKSRV
jgi:transcriptional antiterminator RfaH